MIISLQNESVLGKSRVISFKTVHKDLKNYPMKKMTTILMQQFVRQNVKASLASKHDDSSEALRHHVKITNGAKATRARASDQVKYKKHITRVLQCSRNFAED